MVKKISRSTNVTIMAEDQNVLQCGDQIPQESEDLEISSVKMSGYLKKKRNVGFANLTKLKISRGAMAESWGQADYSCIRAWLHASSVTPSPIISNTICHWLDEWPYRTFQRVGGWSKLYFVLQNSLLMSYNSREEYEKKLVSFKDVICLIPGNTILLPSLEPRFTIASNLNTFYTFVSWNMRWLTQFAICF